MMFPFKNDCTGNLPPLKEADDDAFYQIKGTLDYNLIPFLSHSLLSRLLSAPYMAMLSIEPWLLS